MVPKKVSGTSALQTIRHSYKILQGKQLWQHSGQFMRRHLILVNTGTCTALYITGDFIQQRLEGSKLDWRRSLRMAILGMFMGPLNHGWYSFLDKYIMGTSGRTIVKKVLADQLVMAPICSSFFYIGMCTLERRGLEYTQNELLSKFWPTYKSDWKLWPMAQAVNFYFIPTHLRVTYVNVVTLVWTVYLSYMKHKGKNMTDTT